MKSSTIVDFEQALFLLDKKLDIAGINKIQIRAIGGFAMMYYGFRDNGYTIDIDSLTTKYPVEVLKIIREVAFEMGLDEGWLNTDCSTLEGFMTPLADQIVWEKAKYDFNNIDMKVANVAGLIRSKAKAIEDGGLVPRSTDKKDLLAGLNHVNIHSADALKESTEYSFIIKEYPRCFEFLEKADRW